jgi:DNA polymerase-1
VGSDRPIDHILGALKGVERHDGYFKALCPGHPDQNTPSLSVTEKEDGAVLVHCFVCKDQEKVLRGLEERGIRRSDLFYENGKRPDRNGRKKAKRRMCLTKVYDYKTPDARFIKHHTLRFMAPPEGEMHHPDCLGDHFNSSRKDKDFLQARPDDHGGHVFGLDGVQTILYNLADVMQAALRGEMVVWVEGEKDADNGMERLGLTTTTCPMGAKHWKSYYAGYLTGAHVVIVADNDGPGGEHAEMVATELLPFAANVKVLKLPGLPEKGDLSDWIDAGGTREEFDRLISEAPRFFLPTIESGFGEKELLPVKSLREVVAEAEEAPEFIVKDLLKKGELTDLSGLAKYSGKTTLVMHMLKAVRTRDLFLGEPTKEARILYLTEQGNNFKEAIENAALDLDDDGFVVVQHRDVRGEEWAKLIEKAVKLCEKDGRDVLVVDTFAAFTKLAGSEENNAGDIRERMEPLKKAGQSHDLAVLVVRHAGKDGKGRGSSQFEAEVDIVASLKRPEGNHADTVRQLETIGRYGATKLNIELSEEGYVPLGSDEKVAFSKAVRTIKGVLPRRRENAVTEDALAEKVKGEVSKGTLIRVLRWLVDQETVVREGSGKRGSPYTYWLPPRDPDPSNSFSPNPHPIGGEKETDEKTEGGTGSEGSYELVTDPDRLVEVADYLEGVVEAAIDLETTGLSPIEDKIRLLSVHAGEETFLIDAFEVDPSSVLKALKDKVLYVHGAEFDLPFLFHHYGFEPPVSLIDTLHLSQVARAGEWEGKENGGWQRKRHSLKDALERELEVVLGDKMKFQRGKAWTGDLADEHLEYAGGDVVHLKDLADKLLALIKDRGLTEVWELERRAKPLFLDMCTRGIPLDKKRWERLTGELEERVASLKKKADDLAPPHPEGLQWNWNSPPQAKEAFSVVGLKISDLQRETLSKYEHPLVEAVAEYRNTQSLLSRVRSWAAGRYREGRVYPQWNPAGAATGRASCTSPNVQSLPKGGDFRGCVRPQEGRVLVKADLSQIELRVLAAITEDENMLEIFGRGGDLHLNTAEVLAGRKVKKGDAERQKAKAVNFGLSFGMGAKRFKEMAERDYGIRMTLSEARDAKQKLLAAYPTIGGWHKQESARSEAGDFETFTLLGRRRVVEPDYAGKPSFTERLNAPVQGTAADILKLALAELWEDREAYPHAFPVLTVHDEVVIECDEKDAQGAAAWLSETLRRAVDLVLGLQELAGDDAVEVTIAPSWED